MTLIIIINGLCNISMILASFFCLGRSRFEPEVSRYFSSQLFLKVICIVCIALAYLILNIDWRLLHLNYEIVPLSTSAAYIVLTFLFVMMNITVWNILIQIQNKNL